MDTIQIKSAKGKKSYKDTFTRVWDYRATENQARRDVKPGSPASFSRFKLGVPPEESAALQHPPWMPDYHAYLRPQLIQNLYHATFHDNFSVPEEVSI